jgi:hypothetical protein
MIALRSAGVNWSFPDISAPQACLGHLIADLNTYPATSHLVERLTSVGVLAGS